MDTLEAAERFRDDPLGFVGVAWPGVTFYDKQREVLASLRDNDETFVVAGHQLGKDFTTGYACLHFFLSRRPCRVVITSVKDDHLRVAFGELQRFIQTSRLPMLQKDGGPLVVNHRDVRKVVGGKVCPISYLRGMVSERGEGMAGHHAEHTLLAIDEASGADDEAYRRGATWAKRVLVIGNPYPCPPTHFFQAAVKGGDLRGPDGRLVRKVITIRATDSPNVRLGRRVLPGVLSADEYQKRLLLWDEVRKAVGLRAEFWEGSDALMFPPAWLDRAAELASALRGRPRKVEGVGVDPGEGVADTALYAVDRLGVVDKVSRPTPDTAVIKGEVVAFMAKHGVAGDRVCIDAGGGGTQIAHELREKGHAVRLVAFGAAVAGDAAFGAAEKAAARERRYAYFNRRSQMYGDLRELLDPSSGEGFAVPAEYAELRRQMAPVPLVWDSEGRLKLPPKSRRGAGGEKSLSDIIGRSPDELDALALACHAMLHREGRPVVGGMFRRR